MNGKQLPVVVGVAGTIGAGKSTVARLLATHGMLHIDFDAEAKRALDREDVARELESWWGAPAGNETVLSSDGRVDRARIASVVFHDESARLRLEGLLHPLIWRTRASAREEASEANATGAVLDAPLLFEAGLDKECDQVVFVDAPRHTRLARVRERRGWDEGELARREASQWAGEKKRHLADHVVDNTGSEAELARRVHLLYHALIEAPRGSR